jgi:hypothetical protein
MGRPAPSAKKLVTIRGDGSQYGYPLVERGAKAAQQAAYAFIATSYLPSSKNQFFLDQKCTKSAEILVEAIFCPSFESLRGQGLLSLSVKKLSLLTLEWISCMKVPIPRSRRGQTVSSN